jgi:16S rRNA (cytidine1402-2'-O)-methyltransferase
MKHAKFWQKAHRKTLLTLQQHHETSQSKGKLYLIPTTLGEMNHEDVLPETIKRVLTFIDDYIVENEKTARRFIKSVLSEKVQSTLRISLLNKHTDSTEYSKMIAPCLSGMNVGLMSEAGCLELPIWSSNCKISS